MSIKFVGALLITSMLIIPADAAQLLSRSPEQMVIIAIIGIFSVTIGSYISFLSALLPGPTIVVNTTIILIITLIIRIRLNKKITHLY